MLDSEQVQQIQPKLVLIQVVAGALIMGAVAFAAAMSVIVDWENLNDQANMLTMFAGASGLFIFMMSIFVPLMFAGKSNVSNASSSPVEEPGIAAAIPMLMTETLIRYALIEGGVFLNLMVLIIEPHLASLVVAGIGLLLMLVLFPRRSKMMSTIEDRARNFRP